MISELLFPLVHSSPQVSQVPADPANQPKPQQPQESSAVEISPEVLSKLPPPVQQQILAISQTQHMWAGPLPPPEALEKYQRVIPGSAERLLQLAEKEQAHRHTMDSNVLSTKASDVKRGQYLGGGIALLAVGGAIWLAPVAPWVSGALVSVPIATIINAIVKGRPDKK